MARRWPIAVAAVAALVVGAGVVTALAFDPSSQKPRIIEAVRRATGRELTLAGPLRIGWGLAPVLEAEDVSFANAPGGSRPQMVTVGRVEARVRLLPLLSRRVEIASVTLVRPDILLETDAAGRGNWLFGHPEAVPGPASPSSSGPRMTAQVDSFRVETGHVTWRDGVTGQTQTGDIANLSADGGEGPAHILAQGKLRDTDIRMEATLGTLAQLTGAVPGLWPVKLAASAGTTTLALDGQADPANRTASGRVEATVPDLAQLGALLGRADLPRLLNMHFAATLPQGGGLPQDVSLQVGASDLDPLMPGATLGQLSLTWPAGQAARLDAEGAVAGAPWHVSSSLLAAGQGIALRGLALSSAFGDTAGDLAVTATPRPALRGTLVSTRVDADAIRAALRPAIPPPAAAASPAPAPAPAAGANPVFSTTPLPWGILRRADTDLQWTIGTLHLGGADYTTASAHLSLQDGVGRLDPASAVTPAGRIDLSASVDARAPAPPVALVLRSAGLSLDALLQAAGLPGGSDATAELDMVLQAAGQSPHALAASLGGHVGVALVDGEISNAALAAFLGDLARQAGAGLDSVGRSHVRCLALRADAAGGVVVLSALKLDTARLELGGTGTVSLGDETMALRLRPLLRLGGAGVSAPLRVDGSLRHPAVTLDQAAGTGRTSVTIGGLAGRAGSCAADLAAARDGRAGRLPAELASSNKGLKPADLLRSFLR